MSAGGSRSGEALVFLLGGEAFALPLGAVEEIARASWPLPVARPPYGCLGLLDVRGTLIPALDLAALLALRKPLRLSAGGQHEGLLEEVVGRQLILASAGGVRAALLVDRVLDVGPIVEGPEAAAGGAGGVASPRTGLGAGPAGWAGGSQGATTGWVAGAAEASGRRAVLLSPDRLLGGGRGRLLRKLNPEQAAATR